MRNLKGENGCTCKPGSSGRHPWHCPAHVRARLVKGLEARADIRRAEGAKLRALRTARGLSCARLLPMVGLKHRAHISCMESGSTRIHPRVRAWMQANEKG